MHDAPQVSRAAFWWTAVTCAVFVVIVGVLAWVDVPPTLYDGWR